MFDVATRPEDLTFAIHRNATRAEEPTATPVWIFLCNADTREECLARHLFGTLPMEWRREFGFLEQGDRALLYDYERFEFIGMFEIIEHANGSSLAPKAWHGEFPSQVRVRPIGEQRIALLSDIDLRLAKRILPPWRRGFPITCVEGNDGRALSGLFGVELPRESAPIVDPPARRTRHHQPAPSHADRPVEVPRPETPERIEIRTVATNPHSGPNSSANRSGARRRTLWAFLLRLLGIGMH